MSSPLYFFSRLTDDTEQALFRDMNNHHSEPARKKGGARPWDLPSAKGPLTNTIFGYNFLACIVDESHHMRNPGKKHSATLCILQQATVRLIMTATPLHTSSKVSLHSSCCTWPISYFILRTLQLWDASSEFPTSRPKMRSGKRRRTQRQCED